MNREEFLALVGAGPAEGGARRLAPPELPPEPLPAAPSRFRTAGPLPDGLTGDAPATPAGAALARRLGKFPFWRGAAPLLDFLEAACDSAAASAARTLERLANGT
ncbi:MAG TPA: hypothetical protein VFA33_19465 [Bryobacteraceae bacterium]|nr:hypothetical protein [Bryobacteraceae bacterium]